MAIQTVVIVGVGLIGGSFGLALRARGFSGRILGVSSARTLKSALARGAVDEGVALSKAVPQADLVYLAQPITRIVKLLPEIRELVSKQALVTDAGSTKTAVVERADKFFSKSPWFIGGHPMAGKAKRGVELADANLFQDATYVLTPSKGRLPRAPVVQEFLTWIKKIGARPLILTPALHDEIVTWTSHLPQLVSTALAACVDDAIKTENHLRVAGPGLRDMTRLAESPYDIWKDIFATNGSRLERALALYLRRLERFREHLATSELEPEFESAHRLRKKLVSESKT